MEYFSGPKNVDCIPIMNKTMNSGMICPANRAAAPSAMMTISASLM